MVAELSGNEVSCHLHRIGGVSKKFLGDVQEQDAQEDKVGGFIHVYSWYSVTKLQNTCSLTHFFCIQTN
jgi:hypothetical protein